MNADKIRMYCEFLGKFMVRGAFFYSSFADVVYPMKVRIKSSVNLRIEAWNPPITDRVARAVMANAHVNMFSFLVVEWLRFRKVGFTGRSISLYPLAFVDVGSFMY